MCRAVFCRGERQRDEVGVVMGWGVVLVVRGGRWKRDGDLAWWVGVAVRSGGEAQALMPESDCDRRERCVETWFCWDHVWISR